MCIVPSMARNSTAPKPAKRVQTQIKIDEKLLEQLDFESNDRMINRNLIVERALEELFKSFALQRALAAEAADDE